MSNVLITGGGGFLGSHLIEKLLNNPKIDKILNIDPMQEGFNSANLFTSNKLYNVCYRSGELPNYEMLASYFKPDVIYNIGALTHVDTSIKDPSAFIKWNNMALVNLLEYVKDEVPDVKFIHMSTDEVFGSIKEGFSVDEDENLVEDFLGFKLPKGKAVFNPSSVYSMSKAGQEHLCNLYDDSYGLDMKIVRATNFIGTRQDRKKFVPVVLDKILNKENIPLYGDGLYKRTWLDVRDGVNFLEKFIENNYKEKIFHISNKNNEFTNVDLINKIGETFGIKPKITYVNDRLNHDRRYSLNYENTTKNTGWEPTIKFEDTLKDIVEFYRENY